MTRVSRYTLKRFPAQQLRKTIDIQPDVIRYVTVVVRLCQFFRKMNGAALF